jgi:hypothetical protein
MADLDVHTDIVVAGGGMAGVCAALAAARNGAKVALIHDRPMFGGNASSEIRMHICGADHSNPVWRETGILEEIRLDSLLHNHEHNHSIHDLVLYDKIRREPNIRYFLNARVDGCKTDGRRVVSCTAYEVTSDRRLSFTADQFIDCTGDGNLAYLAGAEYRRGREGRDEFGESLAPEKADNYTLGHSIMFHITDVGRPVPFTPPPWALKFESDEDLPFRDHSNTVVDWWIEWGGTMDTIKDHEAIRDELLACAMGVWDHMKNKGDHGFANYALSWLQFLPGRRESRRFVGDVILTQSDVQSGRQWPDQIGYGGWPIDPHPPLGFRSPEPPCKQYKLDRPYGIPLRACYCRGFDNLYLAGRNVSMSHVAFCSSRVMGTCSSIGQGVGTAAALAVKLGATTKEMAERHVGEVQQILLADGAYLLDIANSDPRDLARSAQVTASSSMGTTYAPEKIIDGINHPTPEDSHTWRSDPTKGFPAWIELKWAQPVEIDHVQIVFDTDFESKLFLTSYPNLQKLSRPVPRSTTVKDFRVEAECSDGPNWIEVASVQNNYQRLVRLRFPAVKTNALRIVAESTWGADYASIIEIRCW